MSEVLIKVEGVSKKFCKDLKRSLWYGMTDIARSVVGGAPTKELREGEFWAVRDVSFEVRRGECLGLIGHNGAGKSTLLKMLNGLINPDEGRIEMHGKIGALIELGAGFNPILTGRENVYNNGAVLGFSKAEIDRKFDDIVAFAEIKEFIDMPVQNYSSGMKVRLGFAIASQMEPDILLVDEVLAVGDVGFRIKCYNEIYRMMEKSAVIFVSHSISQIGKMATKCLLLKNGQICLFNDQINDVLVEYLNQFKKDVITKEGNGNVELVEISINNTLITNNKYTLYEIFNFKIQLVLKPKKEFNALRVLYSIYDIEQKLIFQHLGKVVFFNLNKIDVTDELPKIFLNNGKFYLTIHVFENKDDESRKIIMLGIRNIIQLTSKRDTYIGAAPMVSKYNHEEAS